MSRLELFGQAVARQVNYANKYWALPYEDQSALESPMFDKNQTIELVEIYEACEEVFAATSDTVE